MTTTVTMTTATMMTTVAAMTAAAGATTGGGGGGGGGNIDGDSGVDDNEDEVARTGAATTAGGTDNRQQSTKSGSGRIGAVTVARQRWRRRRQQWQQRRWRRQIGSVVFDAQLERGGWQAVGGGRQRIHYSLFVRSNESKKYCSFSGVSGIFLHVRKLLPRPNFEKVRYARIFDSCDFWRTFSCRPTLFHSFTLSLISTKARYVGIEKKYAELAYFSAISGNFGVQKGMGWCSCTRNKGGRGLARIKPVSESEIPQRRFWRKNIIPYRLGVAHISMLKALEIRNFSFSGVFV
jgi:hypothetical protein